VTTSGVDTGGLGLVGMRERVGLLGGTLAVGPRSTGGFTVRAVLPLAEGEGVR
jgi:signal transduction histidine kinase